MPVGEVPAKYFVNYPAAEQFFPPIRTAFRDAATTVRVVRGRRVNQHPNGGYGLPLLKAGGKPLLHTGADLGWFRQGEPVFAVADGVVRLYQPPLRRLLARSEVRIPVKGPVDYGNMIIIEHRAPAGKHFCSLYAHLGDDRTVRVGDLVTAGQQIGTIGRNSPLVNGGYEPHLHFGIRDGRFSAPGQQLFKFKIGERIFTVRLADAGEDESRITIEPELPGGIRLMTPGSAEVRRKGDDYFLPTFVLYSTPPPNWPDRFVGYAPSLEGWHDPISFLRERRADRDPAAAYYTSPFGDADQPARFVLKKPAPRWNVERWVQPADGDVYLDVSEFHGRVVCLFCFQIACRGSRSHGLPALVKVARHFRGDERVAVVGLQTALKEQRRNTPANLERLAKQLGLDVPLGHCGGGKKPPSIVSDYHIRGTPWVVIIDRDGVVQFSNYAVRPQEIVRRINELTGDQPVEGARMPE